MNRSLFILLSLLMFSVFSCQKESINCKDISQLEGTYSGPYTYFSSGFDMVYDSAGYTITEGFFEDTESGIANITVTILSENECSLSFSGSGILAQAFEAFPVLEYEWEDDLIYNNTLNISGESRNFSLRFESDYQSIEFDWEKLVDAMASTANLHFEGSK